MQTLLRRKRRGSFAISGCHCGSLRRNVGNLTAYVGQGRDLDLPDINHKHPAMTHCLIFASIYTNLQGIYEVFST